MRQTRPQYRQHCFVEELKGIAQHIHSISDPVIVAYLLAQQTQRRASPAQRIFKAMQSLSSQHRFPVELLLLQQLLCKWCDRFFATCCHNMRKVNRYNRASVVTPVTKDNLQSLWRVETFASLSRQLSTNGDPLCARGSPV